MLVLFSLLLPALFPASPELSPCSQPCAGDTHALQHVYIHTYIKNTYCNLHILVLSCWFIYAQEICLHLCLPQCRSLGFPHGGLPSTAMSIYRTLPKVPVRPVQMTPAAPVLPRGISSVFQSQTPFFPPVSLIWFGLFNADGSEHNLCCSSQAGLCNLHLLNMN